jgi:predicted NBD/HSP70 family sugar kinase
MSEAVLAVDLGGTQMRAAVVAGDGTIRARCAQPTPRQADCPDALMALAAQVLDSAPAGRAVVAVPGVVNYREGRLEHAPNLPPGWAAALTSSELESHLDLPVDLANDADAAAVGEALFGAGRGYDDVVYVTVSTGVGAGVLLGGLLVAGTRSAAEVGHTILDLCAEQEGRAATLEELGSGTALGQAAAAAGLPADGAELVALVRAGDRQARRTWDITVDAVAAGVRNLVHLYAPEIIIVGGGVGQAGELLLQPVRNAVHAHATPGRPQPVKVVGAALGDDAGLVGAAGWRQAAARQVRR